MGVCIVADELKMDVREKLVRLVKRAIIDWEHGDASEWIVDHLIANGVMVQKYAYLETVVEVKDNTVCGNVVKIQYKRCSCCKNTVKFFDDYFCGKCGAKLDLQQPPKGE